MLGKRGVTSNLTDPLRSMGLLIPLLAFAKTAEAISSRQKIKVQNGGEERRKNQKISKDNKVLRTKY